MRVTFAHLCDYALVSMDGKISILGIYSGVSVPDLPMVHPQSYVAFQVELHHTEVNRQFPMRVDITGPDGDVLFRANATVSVKGSRRVGEKTRFGQVLPVQNVRFQQEGPHSVNIWLDGRPEHSVEFAVTVRKGAPAGPQT